MVPACHALAPVNPCLCRLTSERANILRINNAIIVHTVGQSVFWDEDDNYMFISSVASLPTMCWIARRPPGCFSSQLSRRRTCSSKMTMVWPSAMRPSICRGDNRRFLSIIVKLVEEEECRGRSEQNYFDIIIKGREGEATRLYSREGKVLLRPRRIPMRSDPTLKCLGRSYTQTAK